MVFVANKAIMVLVNNAKNALTDVQNAQGLSHHSVQNVFKANTQYLADVLNVKIAKISLLSMVFARKSVVKAGKYPLSSSVMMAIQKTEMVVIQNARQKQTGNVMWILSLEEVCAMMPHHLQQKFKAYLNTGIDTFYPLLRSLILIHFRIN